MGVTKPIFWRSLMARSSSMGGPGCDIGRRGGNNVEGTRDDVGLGELGAFELAHDAPVIHDGHPVAAADQLVIIGRVEQDSSALVGKLAHQPVELLLGADVDAARRSLSRMIRGAVISHLAITTFCWLPPDRVETASLGAPILICSRAMPRSTAARSLARSTKGPVEMASSDAIARLSLIDRGSIIPSVLRSSGTSAMPTAGDFAAAGEPGRTSRPSTVISPVTPRTTPNQASSSDFWPCPSRPPRPTISPAPTPSEMRSSCFSQDRFSSASTGFTGPRAGFAGYWVAISRPIIS